MAFQEGSTLLINHNTGYIYLEEYACTENTSWELCRSNGSHCCKHHTM